MTCALALAGNAEEPIIPALRMLFARLGTYMPKKMYMSRGRMNERTKAHIQESQVKTRTVTEHL